jgi:2-desacetyl-2-hydroxyethyl bacteriochlorophyllide A dehydrogenase
LKKHLIGRNLVIKNKNNYRRVIMESLNIVFSEKNKVMVKKEELDIRLNSNEILCRADKSLISTGTETYCLSGIFEKGTLWDSWVKYPFYPGYSMVSKIIEVGDKVSSFKKGERVFSTTPHKQYFKLTDNDNIYIIPQGVSSKEAAWSSLASTTQLAIRAANLKLGSTTAVIGLGLLGQLIVQYLKNAGASRIIIIDKFGNRLKVAEKHGATHLIEAEIETIMDRINELTDNKLLDIVFEVTGNPHVLSYSSRLLKKLGELILVGDSPTPSKQFLGPNIVSDSIKIIGVHANNIVDDRWDFKEMINLFFEFLKSNKMDTEALITNIFSPLDAIEVYGDLKANRSDKLGVIFDWELIN